MIPEYEHADNRPDFHAVVTITLAELADAGFFDLTREDWDFPKYDEAQHSRLCRKITNHYWSREVALTPPGIWKREFLRKLDEVMPKYIQLYRYLAEYPSLFGASTEYYKGRNVSSDFPQTQLSGENGDYASSGTDTEYERMSQMDVLEIAQRIRSYDDVDLMVIDELETMFSCLFTVNVSAY